MFLVILCYSLSTIVTHYSLPTSGLISVATQNSTAISTSISCVTKKVVHCSQSAMALIPECDLKLALEALHARKTEQDELHLYLDYSDKKLSEKGWHRAFQLGMRHAHLTVSKFIQQRRKEICTIQLRN